LPSIGAEIVYAAPVEAELYNYFGGRKWDVVAIVRYPNSTAFRQMAFDPEFQQMNAHKQAGINETIILPTTVISKPDLYPKTNPPFPATATDLPVAMFHVMDYKQFARYQDADSDADNTRTGRDAVYLYNDMVNQTAFDLGIRTVINLKVETILAGPWNGWEEVRIVYYPSHEAVDALAPNPTWVGARQHWAAGMLMTPAFRALPTFINQLYPS